VLTVPVVLSLQLDSHWVAFFLCWFAAFTDWLDGYVARKTNTVSEWGKIMDPVADKVLVGAVVVMLLLKGLLPAWFVTLVVARDIVIILGSLWARRKTTVILPSLMSGKLAVTATALTGAMAMITGGWVLCVLLIISCGLMAVSLWHYGMRLYGILR